MVLLRRIVRFGVGGGAGAGVPGEVANGYGGVPAFGGWPLGRHVEVEVCCRGEVDAATGYFLDIKVIDRATRGVLVPVLASGGNDEVTVLRSVVDGLNGSLGGRLAWIRWSVTPTYSVEVSPMDTSVALLRQRFEIAAAHRLHVPSLSDEENRLLFGRCANPSGHGHNYIIEPCVEVPIGGSTRFGLVDLERLTVAAVVEPFDHRNLNTDCVEFDQSRGGVNPSVENISRVFFGLLAPAVAGAGVKLRSITVWETEKTSSTFPG